MKYLYPLMFFGFCILSSCTSQDEESFEFDLSTVFNQINFDQSEVGQVSTYIRFTGSRFGESISSVEYSGDTLKVELVSVSEGNYTFQERITNGSAVYSASESYIDGHDMLKTSSWRLESDSLRLVDGETFLHWNDEGSIALSFNDDTTTATLREWGTSANGLEKYYGVLTGNINDFNYDDLSVSYLVVNLNILHSDVLEVIGNRPFGIVRSSRINTNDISGSGWDLQLGN